MSARIPTIEAIQQATAREFGVPLSAMQMKRGNDETARKRHAAIALAALLTGHSLSRIGHFFGGIDHTSVIHACRTVARRRLSEAELHDKMRRITREVVGF